MLKNIKSLSLVICLCCFASTAFSQLKVVAPNGDTKVGTTAVAPAAKLHVDGTGSANSGIFENGNVGIGLNNPSALLHVNGSMKVGSIKDFSNTNRFSVINGENTLEAMTYFEMFGNDGTNRAGEFNMTGRYIKVFTGGNINGFGSIAFELKENKDLYAHTSNTFKLGNTSWTTFSDRRLKTNVRAYKAGLKEILKINPVWFNYNGKAGTNKEEEFVGVIAQELQEIAPYAVSNVIYENDDRTIKEEYLGVNDSAIKYMLVNAIQEQHLIILEQEEKLSELAERLEKLENVLAQKSGQSQESNDTSMLLQNKPNPFNNSTMIEYSNIPAAFAKASIVVFNSNGEVFKEFRILENGSGSFQYQIDNQYKGVLFYSLFVDGNLVSTKKMIKS